MRFELGYVSRAGSGVRRAARGEGPRMRGHPWLASLAARVLECKKKGFGRGIPRRAMRRQGKARQRRGKARQGKGTQTTHAGSHESKECFTGTDVQVRRAGAGILSGEIDAWPLSPVVPGPPRLGTCSPSCIRPTLRARSRRADHFASPPFRPPCRKIPWVG